MAIVLIASCTPMAGNKKKTEEKLPPIVAFADSFKANHPDWANNSITMENANKEYLEMIKDTALLYSLTEGIEVKLREMKQDSKGNTMAHFYAWHAQDNIDEHGINKVMFDVVANVNDTLVSKLKENEMYICQWDIISPLNYGAFCALYGEQVSTIQADPGISLSEFSKDIEFSLGLFYAHIISIQKK